MIYNLYYKYQLDKKVSLPIKHLQWVQMLFKCVAFMVFIIVVCKFKFYQATYGVSSSVVIKLHGIGWTNRTDNQRIIWDSMDSVVPHIEENGLFIITNFNVTYNQTQKECPENPTVKNSTCVTDADCKKDIKLENGVTTGKCVQATSDKKTCEIKSWCPLESERTTNNIIKGVEDYTVLIKNKVKFDKGDVLRSNVDDYLNITNKCIYNNSDEVLKYCPIFNVSSIINSTNETEIQDLLTRGGVFRVNINWMCDLDANENLCKPEYTFSRIFDKKSTFNSGMNFRYANYFEREFKEYRTLFKVSGLRILVEVRGYGGKFDIAKTFTLISSLWSIFGLIEIVMKSCGLKIAFCCKEEYRIYEEKICEDINMESSDRCQLA